MLRPATPLSLIFLVAFVLLLLSTLSTPIIQGIPLATYQGWDFGVLGYCKDGECKDPAVGYSTGMLRCQISTETLLRFSSANVFPQTASLLATPQTNSPFPRVPANLYPRSSSSIQSPRY